MRIFTVFRRILDGLKEAFSALTQFVDPSLTNIRPKTGPTFAQEQDLYRTSSQKESDPRKYLN